MKHLGWWMMALASAGMAVSLASSGGAAASPAAAVRTFDGTLSVLTYNIEGLPWPVRVGRADAIGRIAGQLHTMRQAGRQPAVVVLQEAFTDDAAAIAATAGYRYSAGGLGAHAARDDTVAPAARGFAADTSWLKGEALGKYVGSGLRVLSDYPIVRMRRAAFPAYACAGYDCLANKGMMMVTIAPPHGAAPIDIVTTHLNSRGASGTADARSLFAYRLQVAALSQFVRANHDPAHPLIVAGDFNVGGATARRATLLAAAGGWSPTGTERDALGSALAAHEPLSADALWSRRRAKDWQFYDDGSRAHLTVQRIEAPFCRARDGSMLSDHVGYAATYRIDPVTTRAPATATASAAGAGYIAARS